MPRKKKDVPISWEDAIDLFETHLRASRKSGTTIRRYRFALEKLKEHLEEKKAPPPLPGQVTLQELREYQCGLLTGETAKSAKPQAATTVHCTTTILGCFFSFLTAEEKIEKDPTLRLERPKLPDRVPGDVLTVKEIERFLAAPEEGTPWGLRDRALVELYYACGLRLTEALNLDLEDLNRDEREVRIRGKGEKDRVIPVTRSAWNHLALYLERARPVLAAKRPAQTNAVFLSRIGKRMCPASPPTLFKQLKEAAGIRKRVTPHTLRRTFASHLLKNGVNIRVIQELLGHAGLDTTAIYLRLDTSELRRQILLHHPRERFEP
jgi:integrase/recombinase XerD